MTKKYMLFSSDV